MKAMIALLAGSALLPACAAPPAGKSSLDRTIYAKAVAVSSRPQGDYARDDGRKPGEVMQFVGVAPGHTVLDMFSGGGYYTELLSHVVGPSGHVDAHSNDAYLRSVGDEFNARYANERLPNVSILRAENNELQLEAGRYDVIMLVLSYHDIYYENSDDGWPRIDGAKLLAEFYKGLKPGGIVGIVDHAAASGSPRGTGGTTHRIDPDIVLGEMIDAGFEFDSESELLRNTDDDYSRVVYDPELRGKTDRFVLRFRKP